jgi:hypothetical protein
MFVVPPCPGLPAAILVAPLWDEIELMIGALSMSSPRQLEYVWNGGIPP